jgi:hypothetical protein
MQIITLVKKEQSNYQKYSNQAHHSITSLLTVTDLFISFSLDAENSIGNEGAKELSEALKSNTSLASLDLNSKGCLFILFSLNTENNIGKEGAIELSEALKSNSSLTSLFLRGNILVALFHSYSYSE